MTSIDAMEKVGRDDHEWSLRDEAHANNDRWRSSDDDNHDDGQNSVVSKQAAREQLCEHRRRGGSCSHRRNSNDDGSNRNNCDHHHQQGARGTYKCNGRDGRDGRGGRDNQPNGGCDASGGECGRRCDGNDCRAKAPKKARRHCKQGRDFVQQERRHLCRSDGPAHQASEEEATSVAPPRTRSARQTSPRAMMMWTMRTLTTMHSLPSWASVQWGTTL